MIKHRSNRQHTPYIRSALAWLAERGSVGVLRSNGVVVAKGEQSPYTVAFWRRLRDMGLVRICKGKVILIGYNVFPAQ